jgi:hypothetical protein
MLLVTFIIRSVPALTKIRVSSGNKPAHYFIKAQAEKITSPGFLIGFFSKQVLFLAFHRAQQITANPNINILLPPSNAFLTRGQYCSYVMGMSLWWKQIIIPHFGLATGGCIMDGMIKEMELGLS